MTQLYQSKIFANGSTTLPKPVRDALGIKPGDRIRYVISEKGVQFFKVPSENTQSDDPDLRKALDAAEKVMDENRTLLRKLKWILVAEVWFSENQAIPALYTSRRWGVMGRSAADFMKESRWLIML